MLNQILEQAKADMFDAINEGKPTDVRNLLEAQLSTAFTAGVKKGVEEEKERVREICSKLDKDETKVFYEEQEEFISYNQALSDLLSELNKQER
jgi:hypothetical protein